MQTRTTSFRARQALPLLDYLAGLAMVVAVAFAGWTCYHVVGGLPLPLWVILVALPIGSISSRLAAPKEIPLPYELPLGVGLILLGGQFSRATLEMVGVLGGVRLLAHWLMSAAIFWLLIRIRLLPSRQGAFAAVALGGAGISAQVACAGSDPNLSKAELSAGVTLSLLFGGIGLVLFPALSQIFALDAAELAALAGLGSPTTAEAVMSGKAHSPEAFSATGAWRFVVNAMQWLPIVVYLSIFGPKASAKQGVRQVVRNTFSRIPPFALGLAGLGAFALAIGFADGEKAAISSLASWCLLTALAGIGLKLRVSQVRALPPRLLLGSALAWLLGIVVLLASLLLMR